MRVKFTFDEINVKAAYDLFSIKFLCSLRVDTFYASALAVGPLCTIRGAIENHC